MNEKPGPAGLRRRWLPGIPEKYLRLAAVLMVLIILVLALLFRDSLRASATEAIGYPTVFFLPLIANSTVIFPVPGLLVVCSAGVVLNPVIVTLLGGVAMALGEITGYLAGFSGSGFAKNTRLYRRIQPWVKRRGWMVVIVFSAIPNPVFDIVGVTAGAAKMPIWQFLGASWIGKTVMAATASFGCSYGYDFIRNLIQRAG